MPASTRRRNSVVVGSQDDGRCCVTGWLYDDRNYAGARTVSPAPIRVFAEVRRVLSPGAPYVVSYANRYFSAKAVAIWRSLDMAGQASLINLYLERFGFANIDLRLYSDGSKGDPFVTVIGRAGAAVTSSQSHAFQIWICNRL